MMRLIRYLMKPKSKKLRKNTYFAVASVVVFVTTYILILPAITKSTDVFCGHEAHIHSESCYSENKVLVCSKEESEGHQHDDSCYTEQTELTCELEEKVGHSHEESCYEEESILVCTDDSEEHVHDASCYKTERKLVCGLKEEEGHFHNKDCYTSKSYLTCGLKEEEGHKHNQDCYETDKKLTCELEEHEHNLMCYSNPHADLESQSQWERSMEKVELTGEWAKDILLIADSQLGYHESTENYIVNESGKKKGYSRYGEWYGDRYGDWCAMFVSFCIRYADIPSEYMPIEAGCQRWIETMNSKDFPYYYAVNDENDYKLLNDSKDFEPISGDIIFFNWDSYPDSDHVGIVYEVKKDKDGHIEEIKAIEGNSSDVVKYNTYLPDDEKIMGYARVPENPDYVPETEVASETETVAESETDVATESETELETEVVTESQTELETESASEDETELETEAASESETENETESTAEAETPGETEANFETESIEGAVGESSEAETEEVTEESTEVVSSEEGIEETTEAETSESEMESETEVIVDEPITRKVEKNDYSISVTYGKDAKIPQNAVLQAWEYEKNSDVYLKRYQEAATLYNWELSAGYMNDFRLFNIGFFVDGKEIEPESEVKLSITYKNMDTSESSDLLVTHFTEEEAVVLDAVITSIEGDTVIDFSTDGFSDYSTNPRALAASPGSSSHPDCALPGNVSVNHQLIYSLDGSGSTLAAVPGVKYTIYKSNGTVYQTYTSSDSLKIDLGSLPAGTYRIEQTYVPNGYVLTPQTREFTVVNDVYTNVGVFYVYKNGDNISKTDKTAHVVDYENRTYQVDINAISNIYRYNFKPINYSIVVDQSNSMLFPAELIDTGKTVKLVYSGTNVGSNSDSQNNNVRLDNAKLDKNQVYYIIADEKKTSTVFAIWYDSVNNGWCYQDAAYYAKAQFNEKGIYTNLAKEDDVTVVYAKPNYTYSYSYTSEGVKYQATGGGGIQYIASTLGNDATTSGKTYKIYTASEYDRLHELQEAVSLFAQELAALSPDSTLDIITFDKTVESCVENILMNPAGVTDVIRVVNNIATSGGTRQDRALKHLIGQYNGNSMANHTKNHLNNGDIVILVTDGAPVNSSGDNGASIGANTDAASAVKNAGGQLITIGLSTKNVDGGSNALDQMASTTINGVTSGSSDSSIGTWFFDALETGDLTDIMVNKVLFRLADKIYINSSADIKDVISDSFYPVDPFNNEPLKNGDRIALDGSVNSNGPGTVKYDSTKKEWYVEWDNQAIGRSGGIAYTYTDDAGVETQLDTSTIYYINFDNKKAISGSGPFDSTKDKLMYSNGQWIYRWRDWNGDSNRWQSAGNHVSSSENDASWHGSIYLKAKEDFIGGNSIDTNKSATVAIKDEQGNSASISLPTPNVNVRLLPFEGFESEETVFLGDKVSKIKEKLQMLLHKTVFDKINNGEGNNLNYKDWISTESGCYAGNFSIPYSIGELTEANWADLFNGKAVSVDYTYDDDSSHGPVGYFTFSLSKEAVAGEPSEYAEHATEVSGQDVEQYKLTVTYTAYKIGEQNRPGNVHNTTKGPGTEVGTGQNLENGKGTESVDEIHHVHVVPGKIKVTKNIDNTLVSNQDQVFTFYLTREGETEASYSVNVTIKAGVTSGSAEFTLNNKTEVKRGEYVLSEGTSDLYNVASVANETDTTCSFGEITDGSESLLYKIGTNEASKEEDHNVIHVNQTPEYSETSKRYVYSVVSSDITEENISYGHGVINNTKAKYTGEIPVKKVWADGKEHGDDLIYVVLCKDNIPVLSTEGQAQMICLNPANGWEGTFQVGMESKTEDLTQAGYSILEVKDMLDTQPEKDGYTAAVLLGTDQIKYVSLASENDLISVGGITYKVSYESSATSDQRKAAAGKNAVVSPQTLVVKNTTAYELPQTGGVGTRRYTMGGMFLIMAALVLYGFGQRRRRERRFD